MYRRVLAALCGLLLLLAAPTPVRADPATNGVIAGVVLDKGRPVPAVTAGVNWNERIGYSLPPVTTDAAGKFRLEVPPGQYTVTFKTPGGGLIQTFPSGDGRYLTLQAGQTRWITEHLGPHGALAGRILTNHGQPAAGAMVGLGEVASRKPMRTTADADGNFLLDFLPAGDTTVWVMQDSPPQWVPRKETEAEGAVLSIEVGKVLRIEERLLPIGIITGTFTGPDGPILADVDAEGTSVRTAATDGSYTLRLRPGDHRLHFEPLYSSRDQWAPAVLNEEDAMVFHLAEDQVVHHDERQIADGFLAGRLLDHTGQPLAEAATVQLVNPHGPQAQTTTDSTGRWTLAVAPGEYQVRFQAGFRLQAAGERTAGRTGELFTVLPEETTTVPDETLSEPGTVQLSVTVDGEPALAFCAYLLEFTLGEVHYACTEDGTVTYDDVSPIQFQPEFSTSTGSWSPDTPVTAVSGETTSVTLSVNTTGEQ